MDDENAAEAVDGEVNRILEFGKDINFVVDDSEEIDSDRDYDLKFPGQKPPQAKNAVMDKYLRNQTPYERGRRAFQLAKDEFEPEYHSLDDDFE